MGMLYLARNVLIILVLKVNLRANSAKNKELFQAHRRYKRLVGPSNWFKVTPREMEPGRTQKPREDPGEQKKENRKQFQNVMFIPLTRGSRLKKLLQAMEDDLGFDERVKYVERPGANIGDILMRKDPWQSPCGRESCMVCEHTPGVCTNQGVVYKFSCGTCKEKGAEALYFGETSKSMFERISQHHRQITRMDPESPMVEHHLEHHEGAPQTSG